MPLLAFSYIFVLVALVTLVTLVALVTPASLKRSKQDFNGTLRYGQALSGALRYGQALSGALRHSLKCSTSTATQPSSSATRVSTATSVS